MLRITSVGIRRYFEEDIDNIENFKVNVSSRKSVKKRRHLIFSLSSKHDMGKEVTFLSIFKSIDVFLPGEMTCASKIICS